MPRNIPHEHVCYICGKLDGCTDEHCERSRLGHPCGKKSCQAEAKAGVVHLMGANPKAELGCCKKLPNQTPRRDRMVGDPTRVTCPEYKVEGVVA